VEAHFVQIALKKAYPAIQAKFPRPAEAETASKTHLGETKRLVI
jgi:hypothetical protein